MENIIMCMRCADSTLRPIIGSEKVACAKCTSLVWVSPATFEIGSQLKAKILCNHCVPKKVSHIVMSQDQIKESMNYKKEFN